MQTLRKTVLGILLGSFAARVAAGIFIHLYYYSTLPSTPDERAGRTFRVQVNHGFVRYGSAGELRAFRVIEDVFPFAGFPFLAAVFLGMKWGIFQVRK
jgi:hypothetical protein